jgi:hypothetical protein
VEDEINSSGTDFCRHQSARAVFSPDSRLLNNKS